MLNLMMRKWLQSLEDNHSPNLDECIKYLGDYFPLLYKFKETIQDSIWHAEGDVHIHTQMVLDELYSIFNNKEYVPTPSDRRVLILSAVLHDIAKPLVTTVDADGRVKARKHEEVGKNYLVYKLLQLDLPMEEYLKILAIVGFHQTPKLLVIRDEPRHKYLEFNNMINYELIYWLEVADLRGRTCEDREESLMYLDEYKRITEEELNKPYRYYVSSIPNVYTEKRKRYLEVVGNYLINNGQVDSLQSAFAKLYEPSLNYSKVILLCGVSGSGKSQHIKKNYAGYTVISLDNLREQLLKNRQDMSNHGVVIQAAYELLRQCLRNKQNVVWDATNYRKDFRNKILDIAHAYGALSKIVMVLSTTDDIHHRNNLRQHSIPTEDIDRQIKSIEFPDSTEAHIIEYTFNKGY